MKSQIKSGVILGYVNMIVSIVISLVYVPIMLKLMGQSEYGLYSLVASVIAYLSVLDMGFGNAMIRFVSKAKVKNEQKEEMKINGLFLFLYLIIGLITILIGSILVVNVSHIFKALTVAELAKAKIIMAILVVTVAISFPLSVFDSYVIASEKFTFSKVLLLIKNIMFPITMIIFLLFGYKSIAMVIINSSYTIIMHLINLYYCVKKLKMKIHFQFKITDKELFRSIIVYSFFVFINIIIDNLYANTDQVILGIVSGTAAVSVYNIAMQITSINQKFSTNISGVFFPRITKLLEEKNGQKKVSDLFIKVSRIQLYILALILFGFIIFGKSFINIWVGKEFISAYYIILLIIIPAIIPLTQNIGISILQAMNKHKFRSVIYLIIAILNIIISVPLAQRYSGIGAAIGTAIANILGQIITMNIYYYKVAKIDIPKYWKWVLKFTMPLIILTLIIMYFTKDIYMSLAKMCIYGLLFILFYSVYCYRLSNTEEKEYIRKIKKRILKQKNAK